MFLAYLFLEIGVFRFEPHLQGSDFLIRLHVFERQRNLVCDLLQEFGVIVVVVTYLVAGYRKHPDTITADEKRHDAMRSHACSGETALIRKLLLFFQVPTNYWRLMVEDPPNTVALTAY